MKVNQGSHDYLKQLKDPLKKYLCVLSTNFALNVAVCFVYHEILLYITYIPKEKKRQIRAFKKYTFVVYIITKT